MGEELKPCAHCGRNASLEKYEFQDNMGIIPGAEYGISCKCGITLEGFYGQPAHEIIDIWNRRAEPVVSKMENTGYVKEHEG